MVTGKAYWVWGGENRECVALNYLDSWEKMYAESLVFIMAILSGAGFVELERFCSIVHIMLPQRQ